MISDSKTLARFIDLIEESPWIALDTEADSLYSYPERLCLIQISIPENDALIDPLSGLDLEPLFRCLEERELILHGADYDLRLLWKTNRFVPARVFDTMIAARLLGETRFGLGDLVSKHLNVSMSKALRKANWSRRPLSSELVEYAVRDTLHLHDLEAIFRRDLEERGRLEWHSEWCDRLVQTCSQTPVVDEDRVWRLRGSDRLARKSLAVLRELWSWREQEAIASNRPPYFVLSHETLVALAEVASSTPPHKLSPSARLSPRRLEGLRQAAARALELPMERWPEPTGRQSRRPDAPRRKPKGDPKPLRRFRDQRAEELGIDPTLIATKADLDRLSEDWDEGSKELMSWQRDLLSRGRRVTQGGDDPVAPQPQSQG